MTTQKAYRFHSYGGPECIQLDDVPVQTPGPSEVLVAVSKVGMNPFDWKIREGYVREALPLHLPAILGVDFVGTVVALGKDASRLKVGERVMTMSTSLGAYAEYIAVDEKILARVPDAVDDVLAATLPIPASTAWQSLHAAGEIGSKTKILIHGASGTCGAFAVQFAKAAGATVIGTASEKNREYVTGLGADQFIDYKTENFEDLVVDIDLVLDFVLLGGDRNTTNRSWKVLKPNGALVSVSDPTVVSTVPDGLRGFFPTIGPNVPQLEMFAAELAASKIKSKIARIFDRDELIQAMGVNQAGGMTGRLIVNFKRGRVSV